MGVTNLDELNLVTGLAAAQLAGSIPNSKLSTPNHEETLHFFVAGTQTTGTKKAAAIVGLAGTIVDVRAYLDTAPTTSSFIIDVNKNGTTIFTTQANRPTVAIAGNASTTTAPDVTAVAAGDRITVDCDQIGSGTAGSDLYVSVTVKRANVA